MMDVTHVLKRLPHDFVVREVLIPQTCDPADASQRYYLLVKDGFTTTEAVQLVAEQFGVPATEVTYAGLKDEDGITEQLIAVPSSTEHRSEVRLGSSNGRNLHLIAHGCGSSPLRIGNLEGNAFAITVRNLDVTVAHRLYELGKTNHLFLNYYDIQRFGVPGGPRRTHLVGQSILEQRWEDALEELRGLGCPESPAALEWTGSARDFFHGLDPRIVTFYLSAFGSAQWNARLRDLLADVGAVDDLQSSVVEGIPFTYARTSLSARLALLEAPELEYVRYSFSPAGISEWTSTRPTVVQTRLTFAECAEDEMYSGRATLATRFFLPSGCYATAALRQLFGRSDLIGRRDVG